MACFITPLVIGIILGILGRRYRGYNRLKIDVLAYVLIGGALILVVEHLWHGEIVPYPPFLTAMQNPEDISVLFREVGVIGGSMTFAGALLGLGMTYISRKLEVKHLVKVYTTLKT